MITIEEGEFWVEDLGSTNGTFVNDVKITERTQVKDTDTVMFDSQSFVAFAPIEDKTEKSLEPEPVAEPKPVPEPEPAPEPKPYAKGTLLKKISDIRPRPIRRLFGTQ